MGDQDNNNLNWKNTWNTLKGLQGKRCSSIKKSKALMFRIKCLNKLLPTKDICYQRNPTLYQTKTCVACIAKVESLEHLADCQIYQKIWEKVERMIIEELEYKLSSKWEVRISMQSLYNVFLGPSKETQLQRRKLHIRGLTNTSLVSETKDLLGSASKANKAICWFTEIFWSNFFEKIWKFRCEVMTDWEKRNNIDIKKKRKKTNSQKENKAKKNKANKENQDTLREDFKELSGVKERRILEEAEFKVINWIERGTKESWLSLKNN